MISLAWGTYIKLAVSVDKIMGIVTNNEKFIEHNSEFYYDLRKLPNLDYFLARLKREVANTDVNSISLTTIFYVFLIDALLIFIAFYRLLFVTTSINTLTIVLFIDIAILSLIVVGFLIIVAYINQKLTTGIQQLLKRTIAETISKLINIQLMKKKEEKDINEQEYLKNSIRYLSAMSNYIIDDKENYCIRLFYRFIIDLQMVRSVFFSTVIGLASSLFPFLQSKSLLAK
jgi:hypothetical protein